jgi:outer membrane protein assembly factor BamB
MIHVWAGSPNKSEPNDKERRTMTRLRLVLLGALTGLSLFIVGCGDTDSTTAMFRGSPQRDGVCATAGPKILHGEAWKVSTSSDRNMGSTPTVADGVAYFGSLDKCLYAVEVETGKVLWKFQTEGRVFSSPAISGGVVYFGSEDGCLYAVKAGGSGEKWKFKTEGGVYDDPLVVNDTVYFTCTDGYLYALDGDKGDVRWKLHLAEDDVRLTSTASMDGTLFVGNESEDKFFAVTMKTGALLWTCEAKVDEGMRPAVAGGLVFFGDDELSAVDITTGRIVWKHEAHSITSSPSVLDGVVYFGKEELVEYRQYGGSVFSYSLVALATEDGHELWNYEAETEIESALIADGMIYCTTHGGPVHAVALSGEGLWAFEMPGGVSTSLAVTPDRILYGTYNGEFYAMK